jgi:arsenate reductase
MKKKVLFICTHNSARSQMAESFLKTLLGDQIEVQSAGTQPGELNPYVITVMAEVGVDISKNKSKSIQAFQGVQFDIVVTVCDGAKEACQFFPGAKKMVHKSFPDPSKFNGTEDEILSKVRDVRDEIKNWLENEFIPNQLK